jgi:genome maintenance exonuclease 1
MTFELDLVKKSNITFRRRKSSIGRIYENGLDRLVSVTTFLALTSDKDGYLEQWRALVGEEKADLISKTAAARGHSLHHAMEAFLLGNDNPPIIGADVRMLFRSLKAQISANLSVVYGIELPLYSKTLGLAGTTDCIGRWKGKLAVVDWKNSRNDKELDMVQDYFLQAVAYALMFYDMYGKMPELLVVPVFCVNGESRIFEADIKDHLSAFHARWTKFKELMNEKDFQIGEYE